MRVFRTRMSPVGGVVTAVLVVSLSVVTAFAQAAPNGPPLDGEPTRSSGGPTLDVSNPNDGDLLTPGRMYISGVAFDDNAETGIGVDRVSVFIGDRDKGGTFLGDAKLGMHNPEAVEGGDVQFEKAGWSLLTPVLKATGQEVEMHVYARSSVTGREEVVTIPVIMGEQSEGGDDEPEDGTAVGNGTNTAKGTKTTGGTTTTKGTKTTGGTTTAGGTKTTGGTTTAGGTSNAGGTTTGGGPISAGGPITAGGPADEGGPDE
jgi:hypothetical protein